MRRILFDVLEINIAVSLVILLVCLFEKKLCKRYGAGCLKVVWVILAIRLLIPYNFSLPFTEIRLLSIPGFEQEECVDVEGASFDTTVMPESSQLPTVDLTDMNDQKVEPVPEINVETENAVKQPEVSDIPHVSTQEPSVQAQPVHPVYDIAQKPTKVNTFSYATLLAHLWLIGTTAGLCYFIVCSVSFYRQYNKSLHRLSDTTMLKKVNEIQEELIGQKRLEVYESSAISSPMLIGLLHTKLVFPTSQKQWQDKELEYIVSHELWHYRNRDLLWKLLLVLVWCLNWWNPFVLLMKRKCFFYMELACDEGVLKEVQEINRGDYAGMLLRFAGKRNPVSAFSTNFGSGKKRMKQRLDYALWTHKHKKGTVTISLICLLVICAGLFISCGYKPEEVDIEKKDIEETEETEVEEATVNTLEKENLVENLPVFFADSLETADIEEHFLISSLYCKNRKTVGNQYIIDEEQVLWGYGNNEFGQLGIGQVDFEYHYTEPVKIAENVVSVDASGNGYFAIYLTEDGNLYGMGSNRLGLLGQPYEVCYSDHDYSKITEPVLLMQDVVYASAGMKSILALKQDGTVWWWGEYSSTYLTEAKAYNYQYYWQDEEDEKNPTKILYTAPKMILEDCIYAVTGDWHGAAITADEELYTWGLNILGECGVKVGDDDYVRIPTKVLDGVSMVWVERINNRGFEQGVYDTSKHRNKYNFNVFVQLKDGTFLAAGKDLGNMQKTIEVTGDIFQAGTETYSDSFVPIMVEEYSEDSCRETLNELQWEMTISEAKVILDQQNMDYFETLFSGEKIDDERVAQSISVNANSYLLYFDKNKGLYQIDLQEGGSRNGRFSLGMTLEEVQALLDCRLIYEPDVYAQSQVYRTSEPIEGTYYTFVFDNTKKTLIIVRESSRLKFRN